MNVRVITSGRTGNVLLGSVLVLLAGITLVNMSTGRTLVALTGFLLTGLELGPVTPTFYALAGRTFPRETGSAVGFVQAIGLLGAVLFPWLGGSLMGRFGPAIGVRLILLTASAIALLSFSIRSRIGESATAARRPSGRQRA